MLLFARKESGLIVMKVELNHHVAKLMSAGITGATSRPARLIESHLSALLTFPIYLINARGYGCMAPFRDDFELVGNNVLGDFVEEFSGVEIEQDSMILFCDPDMLEEAPGQSLKRFSSYMAGRAAAEISLFFGRTSSHGVLADDIVAVTATYNIWHEAVSKHKDNLEFCLVSFANGMWCVLSEHWVDSDDTFHRDSYQRQKEFLGILSAQITSSITRMDEKGSETPELAELRINTTHDTLSARQSCYDYMAFASISGLNMLCNEKPSEKLNKCVKNCPGIKYSRLAA